jgi:hypothetical protein
MLLLRALSQRAVAGRSSTIPQMKGSDLVSTRVKIVSYLFNYRFPGWAFAAAILILIVGVKYLMT